MIDLDTVKRSAEWLSLSDGVRLKVRPYDLVVWELARLRSFDMAARLTDQSRAAADLGLDDAALPDLSDPLAVQAVGSALFTISLAQAVIVEWDGVNSAGQPAPITADTVAALMRVRGMAEAFLNAYGSAYDIGTEAAQGNA